MRIDSIEFLLSGGVVSIIFVLLIVIIVFMVHDQSASKDKFCWHRLTTDCYHITAIDEKGKIWIADIHYNTRDSFPICRTKAKRRIQIRLPADLTKTEFIKFASTLTDVDDYVLKLVKGTIQNTIPHELNLSRVDRTIYTEFKHHLLLKALKG